MGTRRSERVGTIVMSTVINDDPVRFLGMGIGGSKGMIAQIEGGHTTVAGDAGDV